MADDARLIIELEARMDKLSTQLGKANQSLYAFSANAEKHAKTASSALERIGTNSNWSKALDKAFDSSRLASLEVGGERLRLFGSALEPLGLIGVGAAAGIAAFTVAAAGALKAIDWAETLARTAKTIGLTTSQLQQFDYVAHASGVPIEEMRTSISGLNEKIGQMQAGIARGLQAKAFAALDLSPETLRKLGDVSNILPVIADRIRALPASEREGIAQRLDITPILPALLRGSDGLRQLAAEAAKTGAVVSDELIAKGAVAAENMNKLGDVIKGNLSTAFIELVPDIHAAAQAVGDFMRTMVYDLQISEQTLGDFGRLWLDMANLRLKRLGGDLGNVGGDLADGAVRPAAFDNDTLAALIEARFAGHPTAKDLTGGAGKKTRARGAHDPRDDTAERLKSAEDALESAHRELAEAEKSLTEDVRARAALEADAVNAEAAKQTADLTKQRADLLKDKGIDGHDSDIAQAKIEQAIADVEAARIAKLQALARQAAFAIEDKQIDVHKALFAAQVAELQSQADITANLAERRRIEAEILRLKQQEQSDLEGTKIDRQVKLGAITPEQGRQYKAALGGTQAAESATFGQKQFLAANPLAAFAQQGQEQYGDLGVDFQNGLVKAMESFNASVATSIANGEKFKDVWVSALKSLETELIDGLLRKLESSLIMSLFGMIGLGGFGAGAGGGFAIGMTPAGMGAGIGGFAGGGRISGPGTGSSDSMLARVSDGEFIVNADATRQALPLLSAINSGHWSKYAAGGLIGSVAGTHLGSLRPPSANDGGGPHFDLRGAVMTADLVKQMNAIGQFYGDRAVARATAASKAGLPGAQRQLRMLTG